MFRWFRRRRDAKLIRGAFGNTFTPNMIREVVRNPGILRLGGEAREVTVLYCGLDGAESIYTLPPEQSTSFLNMYLDEVSTAVTAANGVVESFYGDRAKIFFGESSL